MSTIVQLAPGEVSMAAHVGGLRRMKHQQRGTKGRYGEVNGEALWDIDINGCMGEIACAKWLNLYWEGAIDNIELRDVGGLVDVRSVSRQHYRLVLHERDPDRTPFVNAWVNGSRVELQGWLFAHEGKKPEYWTELSDGRFSFAYPKKLPLRSMEELRDWVMVEPPIWRKRSAA
jgi:hypothetical protein